MGMVTPILLCYIFKTFLNGVCSVMDNTLIGNRENELNTGQSCTKKYQLDNQKSQVDDLIL